MESSSENNQVNSEYEFTQQQNGIIEKLAYEIHWVSVGFTVLGLLYALHTVSFLPKTFQSYYTLFPTILLGLISLFLFSMESGRAMLQKPLSKWSQAKGKISST